MFLPGIGCADIEPPENAYVEREADKVIIGCLTSMEKVTLDWIKEHQNSNKINYSFCTFQTMHVLGYNGRDLDTPFNGCNQFAMQTHVIV